MKKQLLLMLLMMLPMVASADAVEINGIYYNLISMTKEAEVISNPNKYTGDVVIPESVTYQDANYSVASIGYRAFLNCSGLTSVVISNNVISIGSSAFDGCSRLTAITIPCSVLSIGNWAFKNCSSLTSVTIPNSVTEIGEFAFSGCKQLSQLVFPENLKYLEIGVCYDCEKLSSISLPSCIEGIGRSAFYGCTSLEEFVVPDSVKEIDRMAFKNCSSLKKIYWGKSIEKVGDDLFTGCRILKEVYITDISNWCKTNFTSESANPLYEQGIVGGGTKLFLNDELVETLFIPNDIDIVRKYTFYGYTWLKSIRFPETKMKVEDEAFSECRQISSVYFGDSTIQLGNQVFYKCEDMQYVVSKCHEPYMFWDGTFYKTIYGKCTLFIPTGTKEIYASTSGWKNFTKVKEIDVDDPGLKVSLKVSGEGKVSVNDVNVDDNNTVIALYGTNVKFSFKPELGYQIKSFLVNGEELSQNIIDDTYIINQIRNDIDVDIVFDEIPLADGVLFSDNRIFYSIIEKSDGFCLEVTRKMKSGNTWLYTGDVVIPEYVVFHGDTLFVEQIGENAFKGSSSLYSVTMPNTIKTIGKSAFGNCTVLKSITIPSSVEVIEKGAFNGCTAITSFVIPNSVKRIEAGAFYACTKLSSITFSNSLYDVGYDAFGYTKWFNSKSNGLVYAGPVAYKYKDTIPQGTSVNIQNGTLGIAEQCFLDCTGLSSITIPETVIYIGNSALQGCKGLTSIKIPESVTHISNNMLSLCSNITEITLGSNVETIGSYAFAYTNIKKIDLPEELKEIDDFAFVLCSNLESLTIPESVNSIGKSAFANCYGLESVNALPSSPPFLYDNSFSNFSVPLKVPKGCKEVYQSAQGWKNFMNISDVYKYKLTYVVDGDEYKSYEIEEETTITPEKEPTKIGFTFSGWSEIPETMPAHDVTVTGSFSVNSYKLTYMIDDKVYKETMYEYGATITPEPKPEGDYATFEWTDLPQAMPAHDVVVYANYTMGIIEILMTTQRIIRINSSNGKKLKKLQKGLNIVVLDDGTVKKIVVK